MEKIEVKTKGEARQYAIRWQLWASSKSLSYEELAEWGAICRELEEKYNLQEEFKENGII